MIVVNSVIALPFVLMLWAVDTFIAIVALRLILDGLGGARAGRFKDCLHGLTEPVRLTLCRRVPGVPMADWLMWFLVIVAGLTLRRLLVALILALP